MMINLRKWFLMAFGIIALSSLVFYPVSNTYAKGLDDNDNKNENSNDDNGSDIRMGPGAGGGIGGILDDKGNGNDDGGGRRPPQVKSSELKCKKGKCRCKTQNNFRTSNDVYAVGERFRPSLFVHVFVVGNQEWKTRRPIGADVTPDGENQITTDAEGRFPCTKIWGNPLVAGNYDIVVDNNCDGTFDPADGDAVDGRSKDRGFRVR